MKTKEFLKRSSTWDLKYQPDLQVGTVTLRKLLQKMCS
jgi:hypothetical protein